jgi:hypothetical protein
MQHNRISLFPLLALMLCLFLPACARNEAPKPLTMEEIPAVMNKAFAKAPVEQKELVERALSALQAKETAKALMVVEGLCAVPELTPEQRSAASRAVLTLNQAVQAAAQSGDKAAAEVQRMRQSTR